MDDSQYETLLEVELEQAKVLERIANALEKLAKLVELG